jgi:hypothetical protein
MLATKILHRVVNELDVYRGSLLEDAVVVVQIVVSAVQSRTLLSRYCTYPCMASRDSKRETGEGLAAASH